MAVFDPGDANLSSNYAAIQRAYEQRAALEATNPGQYGIANAIATPLAAELEKKRKYQEEQNLLTFKSSLQKELDNNKFNNDMVKEGRKIVTPDMTQAIEQDQQLPQGSLSYVNGRALTESELTDMITKATMQVHHKKFAETQGDKKEAVLGSKPGDAEKQFLESNDVYATKQGRPITGFDNFGRKIAKYNDGTTQIITGDAITPVESGKVATQRANLYPKETEKIDKAIETLRKESKDKTTQLEKIDTTMKIVEENNPNTLINIKAEDLQTSGISGGRLNQKYIDSEGYNSGIISKGQQLLTKWKGEKALSEENKNYVLAYLKVKKAQAAAELQDRIENTSKALHGSLPVPGRVDPEFIKQEVKAPFSSFLPEKSITPQQNIKNAIEKYLEERQGKGNYTSEDMNKVADGLLGNSDRLKNFLGKYGSK